MDTVPEAVRAQIAGGGAALPRSLRRRPAGHLAARVRLLPGRRALPARKRASATSSSTRTASPTPTRGRARRLRADRLAGRRRRSSAATRSRRSRSGAPRSGYPGDSDYREFYRDVGFDLDYDYLRPTSMPDGHPQEPRHQVLQDHRQGRPGDKQPYDPRRARREKAADHAGNFMFNREKQVERPRGTMDRPPLIVAPTTPSSSATGGSRGRTCSNFLFRKMHFDQDEVRRVTPSEYLDAPPGAARWRSRRCPPGAPRATPRSG